jgi:hypothetical protein
VKYNHRLGKTIYVAHFLNLNRPFRYVCLIDADGIDPKTALGVGKPKRRQGTK